MPHPSTKLLKMGAGMGTRDHLRRLPHIYLFPRPHFVSSTIMWSALLPLRAIGRAGRDAAMLLNSGAKLGPYEILAPIGAGGMGEVYRAHDPRMGRDVAIKVC